VAGAAWLAVTVLAAAGCLGRSAAHHAAPRCTRAATAAAPAASAAVPVATSYLTALADHRYDHAQAFAHACSAGQARSLDRLWLSLASMPIDSARVAGARVTPDAGGVTVRATVFARFGPPPYSAWVTLGPRTLRLGDERGRWRVRADVSHPHRSDLAVYGFSWFHHPYFVNGTRVTVVYASAADLADARQILDTAEAATPRLVRRYGGGQAAERPVIFLIDNRSEGERLAHVDLGKVRTPAGFQYSSFAYVDLPEWRSLPAVEQQSMVVHELTHVVTRSMLAGSPHSLLEGIAMYEEDRYLRAYGEATSLDLLYAFQAHGGFPSMRIWERRESDWGLRSVNGVDACYQDALAMTDAIVDRHGGVAALRRLGAAFRAEHASRDFTAAQVGEAFRRALGVPFARVAADARAYTRRAVLASG
jgi:hypothetical protein